MIQRPYLAFRLHPANRFSFPVLLNRIEREGLDERFRIIFLQNEQDVREFTSRSPEGLLFYSFMTPHLPEVYREVQFIRTGLARKLRLVAGGPHATGDPVSTLQAGFDYVYRGAGETGVHRLLEWLLTNRLPEPPAVFQAPDLESLDESYPISRHLPTYPPLEITRGCFWNCRFCQTASRRAQHRSLESIFRYYAHLKERGYHRRVSFICPSAFEYGASGARNLNYPAVEKLLAYCKQQGTEYLEYGIFPSETRPNSFQEEFVELIPRYCSNRKITIGAQSGSLRMLKIIRRGHNLEQVERACEMAAQHGLRPLVDMILGFPEENPDDRKVTLKFMKWLHVRYHARIHVHYFFPLAGTPLQTADPTPLDYFTLDRLKKYERDGVCTSWWEEGLRMSREYVALREQLREKPAPEFQEIYIGSTS